MFTWVDSKIAQWEHWKNTRFSKNIFKDVIIDRKEKESVVVQAWKIETLTI